MTLLVNAYTRDNEGRMEFIEPENPSREQAGFEDYRKRLYGSQAARKLGLRILPMLAGGDVYAEGPDVDRLRQEAERALANIESFVAEAGASAEDLRPRFENIIAAARAAAAVGGGVVIW